MSAYVLNCSTNSYHRTERKGGELVETMLLLTIVNKQHHLPFPSQMAFELCILMAAVGV